MDQCGKEKCAINPGKAHPKLNGDSHHFQQQQNQQLHNEAEQLHNEAKELLNEKQLQPGQEKQQQVASLKDEPECFCHKTQSSS